jgi:NosR/NirI family nitrous oxide reductase transcriptional regulator
VRSFLNIEATRTDNGLAKIFLTLLTSAKNSAQLMVSSLNWLGNYAYWLHGQWPSGAVERLPLVNDDFSTNVSGVYVVGDLTGIPLLKFSADSGARAIDEITSDPTFAKRKPGASIFDVIIIGGGVSGYSAALQADQHQLSFQLLESSEDFSTIKNFPKGKPIFTYPLAMKPQGEIQFTNADNTKEALFENLKRKTTSSDIESVKKSVSLVQRKGKHINVVTTSGDILQAHRVVIAIGKSGNYRRIGAQGEDNPKVVNRLHDPKDYVDDHVAIIGGGDSALEGAIAIAKAKSASGDTASFSSSLKLICRGSSFPNAKQANVDALLDLEKEEKVDIIRATTLESISDSSITVRHDTGEKSTYANDNILSLIGREAPLDFFRRSKISISGESSAVGWLSFLFFLLFVTLLYDWKNYGFLDEFWGLSQFPDQGPNFLSGFSEWWRVTIEDRSTLLGTIAVSMKSRSFYYTLLYTSCIGFFGWRRIYRRKTPYVTAQTWSLFLVQLIPLFLLPELILPWLGYSGAFDSGQLKTVVDSLFPSYISAADLAAHNWPEWGHPRAYWHAYGLILAWPLNVYNVFTPTPMAGWLVISFVQTFILIPALIFKYGKGAYCGWICSCGALAETMGDTQRHKMPHGAMSNKLNFLGQAILVLAVAMLFIRIAGWIAPQSWAGIYFDLLLKGENQDYQLVNALSWKWGIDVLFGGILGVGLYFKYSGRIWCRFACPLAALMNIYTRFSRFRIFSEKEKCISCNQCTSTCHQGIDIMAFANKGKPMEDPQCVRCSACVEVCPTGVLSFGEIDPATGAALKYDRLKANRIPAVQL